MAVHDIHPIVKVKNKYDIIQWLFSSKIIKRGFKKRIIINRHWTKLKSISYYQLQCPLNELILYSEFYMILSCACYFVEFHFLQRSTKSFICKPVGRYFSRMWMCVCSLFLLLRGWNKIRLILSYHYLSIINRSIVAA